MLSICMREVGSCGFGRGASFIFERTRYCRCAGLKFGLEAFVGHAQEQVELVNSALTRKGFSS